MTDRIIEVRERIKKRSSKTNVWPFLQALDNSEYIACLKDPLIEKFITKMINKKGVKENYRKIHTREIM